MTIFLFDTPQTHTAFYPLSLTRPVACLRYGMLTIRERWQRLTGWPVQVLAAGYLAGAADLSLPAASVAGEKSGPYLYIDATLLPEHTDQLTALPVGKALYFRERLVAVKTDHLLPYPLDVSTITGLETAPLDEAAFLQAPWQLFQNNAAAIVADYHLLTSGRQSESLHPSAVITGGEAVFVEAGAEVKGCWINASEGPVYIGKDALVMEGTAIRGPVAICHNAVVKMGAKLYGGTTIGPYSTAGGEIKNAILTGYSNKAHDGYLGDAVIGTWCNLGAGTTNSNLKNTAGVVKMWSGAAGEPVAVGNKAGLIMGDYSRSAVNTGFNTGSVVGICSNVFGAHQPAKHLPSFTWGNTWYLLEKALADIGRWKALKGRKLEAGEEKMIREIYLQQQPTETI